MAFSHRIVTQRTRLFAALLAMGGLVAGLLVVELAPSREVEMVQMQAHPQDAPDEELAMSPLDVAFPPSTVRADDAICAWTADHLHNHHRALTLSAQNFPRHGLSAVRLVDAYIELECPNRIHDGKWPIAAEILGVGVIADALAADDRLLDLDHRLPAASRELVPTASLTFHILAPQQLCEDAARGAVELVETCIESVGWFYPRQDH